MLPDFTNPADWLPWAFASLMGLSILIYVILDGFDLGVGVLFPLATPEEQDRMIGSIGPFWDANETWLVLAVGLLLVAFPGARDDPVDALPAGLRHACGPDPARCGLRVPRQGPRSSQAAVEPAVLRGSLMTALSQGFMLGLYIMGLETTPATYAFAVLTAVFLAVGYSFIGSTWLIHKTEGALQAKSVRWAKESLWGVILGIGAVSLATPLRQPAHLRQMVHLPRGLSTSRRCRSSRATGVVALDDAAPDALFRGPPSWLPFAVSSALFALAYLGMAYSFYPYVVPERLTIYEAAAAPESLLIILIGACFVVPVILGYSVLAYVIFRGKATALRYD
jgi:cytochrome d ubiquinol oxidase subunit II